MSSNIPPIVHALYPIYTTFSKVIHKATGGSNVVLEGLFVRSVYTHNWLQNYSNRRYTLPRVITALFLVTKNTRIPSRIENEVRNKLQEIPPLLKTALVCSFATGTLSALCARHFVVSFMANSYFATRISLFAATFFAIISHDCAIVASFGSELLHSALQVLDSKFAVKGATAADNAINLIETLILPSLFLAKIPMARSELTRLTRTPLVKTASRFMPSNIQQERQQPPEDRQMSETNQQSEITGLYRELTGESLQNPELTTHSPSTSSTSSESEPSQTSLRQRHPHTRAYE